VRHQLLWQQQEMDKHQLHLVVQQQMDLQLRITQFRHMTATEML
jgi:hypothetical protein